MNNVKKDRYLKHAQDTQGTAGQASCVNEAASPKYFIMVTAVDTHLERGNLESWDLPDTLNSMFHAARDSRRNGDLVITIGKVNE